MINTLLAKLFAKFKTKNPKYYSIMLSVIAAVWILNGQGIIHLPQQVVDCLIALGLVSGTHTTEIIEKAKDEE